MTVKKAGMALALISLAVGLWARLYRITANDFVYYDEGLWLNQDRAFVRLVEQNPPQGFSQWAVVARLSVRLSLATAKSLWAFLTKLRVLGPGAEAWYFPRCLSAVCGILTLPLVYGFARRYYGVAEAGWLAVALMAVFPSHVYYSRLALQEALTTLLFLWGLYWYLFPRRFGARTVLSAGLLTLVFLANYRMIIAPVFVAVAALWDAFSRGQRLDIRKYVWHTVIFFCGVFGIGALYQGSNTRATFVWMFRQAQLAGGAFHWGDLVSYPYYLFRLEGVLFGGLFCSSLYLVYRRQWRMLLPFVVVVVFMGVFSLPHDKAVRYLCAAMPLMVLSVTGVVLFLWQTVRDARWQKAIVVLVIMMAAAMVTRTLGVASFTTAYASSVKETLARDPKAGLLSTQPLVQNLFVADPARVRPAPHQARMLVAAYLQGYRYLVIDPQAYISYTADHKHFSFPLIDYLAFIQRHVQPVAVYDHFSTRLLERFVWEHNDGFQRARSFLTKARSEGLGRLRVYDLRSCLVAMKKAGLL